jgi:hypothetical protein
MRYEVHYLADGEERIEIVDAPDAPAAASLIQYEHGRDEASYELLAVTLIENGNDHSLSNSASAKDSPN